MGIVGIVGIDGTVGAPTPPSSHLIETGTPWLARSPYSSTYSSRYYSTVPIGHYPRHSRSYTPVFGAQQLVKQVESEAGPNMVIRARQPGLQGVQWDQSGAGGRWCLRLGGCTDTRSG